MTARTPGQVAAAMAAAAALVDYDDGGTWADALFADGPDGLPVPAPAGTADRELLAALASEYSRLDEHLAMLPEVTATWWLHEVLGIAALPAVPDRIVAHLDIDPQAAPVVLARGALLRGGTDAFGSERRYATDDVLTAHGATLAGVRSFAPGDPPRPHGVAAAAPGFPLRPGDGPDARHAVRIHSAALAFAGGDLTAALAFTDATGEPGLSSLMWRWSRADGTTSGTTGGIRDGRQVTVTLSGGCGAPEGQVPWIEGVLVDGTPVPVDLAFTGVSVRVAHRTPYVPEAAFYNDGAVDATKEFQPFGAAAKRGDAFYLRSDEAFGKALDHLEVGVRVLQAGGAPLTASTGGSGIPLYLAQRVQDQLQQMKVALGEQYTLVATEWEAIHGSVSTTTTPAVQWQRRQDGDWTPVGTASASFSSLAADLPGAPVASEEFAVAGQPGHYLRAFLAAGDFGWTDYQARVADFATRAVAGGTPKPTMPKVPVPPIASAITLAYSTVPVEADAIEATSGWRRQIRARGSTGPFVPFRLSVDDAGATAMVALGLDLPGTALGSGISVYLQVDSAASCAGTDTLDATWQYWATDHWAPLATADGTHQLREAGLLRFAAPTAWSPGCPDVSAATGRWIRLATGRPGRLGTLAGVVMDAVTATFASTAADPATDPSSATALPTGTIKGTLAPVPGVKKATNLASVPGRAPETPAAHRARAAARVRTRSRWITPWDLETEVRQGFPETATVLCLPHTGPDGARSPGHVGLVVVPDQPGDPAPRPSVSLATRIAAHLGPGTPSGARVHVLCPAYATATVTASILLRPGTAALTGTETATAALEAALHPASGAPRWGRTLYASTLIALLESLPEVDVVTSFALQDEAGTGVEQIDVDPDRGLYCSAGRHRITCQEQP